MSLVLEGGQSYMAGADGSIYRLKDKNMVFDDAVWPDDFTLVGKVPVTYHGEPKFFIAETMTLDTVKTLP